VIEVYGIDCHGGQWFADGGWMVEGCPESWYGYRCVSWLFYKIL